MPKKSRRGARIIQERLSGAEGTPRIIQEWEIGGKNLPKPSISRIDTLGQSKNRKKEPKCHKFDRLTLQPSFKLVTERAVTADEEGT
jgi:hypothetical protein